MCLWTTHLNFLGLSFLSYKMQRQDNVECSSTLKFSFIWRRKLQPTPVFLPEKFHGQEESGSWLQSKGLQSRTQLSERAQHMQQHADRFTVASFAQTNQSTHRTFDLLLLIIPLQDQQIQSWSLENLLLPFSIPTNNIIVQREIMLSPLQSF